ncbi:MAG TPA: hypothetical protein VIS48_00835 [Candidatus Kryptonia bacterium]
MDVYGEGTNGSSSLRTNNLTGRFWMICAIVYVAMICIACPECSAAGSLDVETNHQYWLGIGLGFGGWNTHFAVGSDISFSFLDMHSQYTVRLGRVVGIGGTNSILGNPSQMSEYGLMYGRVARFNGSCASVSAGLGLTVEKTTRFGIPLEAGLYAGELNWLGIALKICANISPGPGPSRSYWCVTLGLLVGKLR